MIIDVIPEIRTHEIEFFSYSVPETLEKDIIIGQMVKIPFGKKFIRGVVKSMNPKVDSSVKLKPIHSLIDQIIPEKYLEIALWVSKYYLCSLGEAISLFLPPEMKKPRKVESQILVKPDVSKRQLTKEQEDIFLSLKNSHKPALIHGVTGSGKTEIYIELAKETIAKGQQVIVLVPEIILTPQTVERFEQIFGDMVVLMHSHLSKSEKYSCYQDFRSGAKPIIIGPRSALLVPSEKIGLIIIDEEQEDSYKQEQSPRYHAVTLAEIIAEKFGALLLLGSATPRIETYFNAKIGKYNLFEIKNRYLKESLPKAKIIDLKYEIKSGNFSPISEALSERIRENLEEKNQVLLFINRRGSSTFVSCRDCGHIMLCKNCSIPLVFHVGEKSDQLVCHHCDWKTPAPSICPNCQSLRIKYFGSGIEKIEKEIRKIFPLARVAKIDSSTIKSKNDYEKFYQDFKNHRIDIVIGTQMIAKGLDIPGVNLVGIVSADTGLHLPHYKAGERSFQLLTQVAGRSGRREAIGETIIQSYWPESLPISYSASHDFEGFYNGEIVEREKYHYPPFVKLIRVLAENTNPEKALKNLNQLAETLRNMKIEFIGPGACFHQRLRGRYRFHLIIKTLALPDEKIEQIFKKFPDLVWDTEPVNLL